jgi:DNA-binding HxlR family transcriptional regulator
MHDGAMPDRKLARLAALLHHRWSVPVLATLLVGSGAKFVTLARRLDLSRDSLRRTLDVLIAQRWVMRNPGHGHPMRPEYVLTASGKRLAPWCRRLVTALVALEATEVGLRKWSMPVALAVGAGRSRFSELRAAMPDLTARGLALALKGLQEAELVDRLVSDDFPPTTRYRLTRRARRLTPVLDQF